MIRRMLLASGKESNSYSLFKKMCLLESY